MPTKIKVDSVRKSFQNDKVRLQVIEGLDFEVNEGEFVAIVGPSGCGKTTLMNIIAGFLAPDSGAVHVNGVVRNGPNRNGIMITQQGSVFPWLTVKQNLLFGLPEDLPNRDALAHEYAALVGLKGFEDYYPSQISGGMQKRAGLARAMALDPGILFFDEPSAGLDPISARRLDELILNLRDSLGMTAVVVSHDLASIFAIGNNSIYLDVPSRAITANGPPKELLAGTQDATLRSFLMRGEKP